MHLYLNNCGLSYATLEALVPFLKHSPSLLAVHLSNNPGLKNRLEILAQMFEIEIEKTKCKANIQFDVIYDQQNSANANAALLSGENWEQLQLKKLIREKRTHTSYLKT